MKVAHLDNNSLYLKLNLTSRLSSTILLFKFTEPAVIRLISRPFFSYNELLVRSVLKLLLKINSEYKMHSLISVSACTVQSWNLFQYQISNCFSVKSDTKFLSASTWRLVHFVYL